MRDFLNGAPVATLTGNEFPFSDSVCEKANFASIQNYYKSTISGRDDNGNPSVTTADIGNVSLSLRSIRESFHHYNLEPSEIRAPV